MAEFNDLKVEDQEQFLFNVPLPEETPTYVPISHKMMIKNTESMLAVAGRTVSKKHYYIAENGDIMTGQWTLEPDKPGETLEDVLAMQNSYNKRTTLKFAYGIYDPENKASLISGEVSFKRRHTGKIEKEFEEVLNKSITFISDHREELINDIGMLKATDISRDLASEINGRLFFNEGVISTSNVAALRRNFNSKSRAMFDEDNMTTLWKYYDYLSKELRTLHASKQIDHHIAVYNFLKIKFGLI